MYGIYVDVNVRTPDAFACAVRTNIAQRPTVTMIIIEACKCIYARGTATGFASIQKQTIHTRSSIRSEPKSYHHLDVHTSTIRDLACGHKSQSTVFRIN